MQGRWRLKDAGVLSKNRTLDRIVELQGEPKRTRLEAKLVTTVDRYARINCYNKWNMTVPCNLLPSLGVGDSLHGVRTTPPEVAVLLLEAQIPQTTW